MRALIALAALCAAGTAQAAPATDWRARADGLLADAVAVPSVDGKTGARPVAERLAREFLAAGFPAADVRVLPYKQTAALMVRLKAARPKRGAVLLLGHMDVVDALPEDWSRDPFKLIAEDGYYYGRGTSDMKGGFVAQAIALLRLKAEGVKLDRDVILFATGDEESEGEGAAKIVGEWRPLHNAVIALNADGGGGSIDRAGRPLGFRLQTSEKTYASFTFTARNRGGHSSRPRADNAIYALAGALGRLSAYRFAPMLNETVKAYLENSAPLRQPELAAAMRAFAKDPANIAAADRIDADDGEIGMMRTTCVATLLNGGHAENALPQTATATVNCRIFPGVSADQVQAELQSVAGKDVAVARLNAFGDGTQPSPLTDEIVGAYTKAVRARHPGVPIIPEMTPGATDGGRLRANGIPTYGVDGLWRVDPDDMRAHGKDERILIEAFHADLDHWYDLIRNISGAPRR